MKSQDSNKASGSIEQKQDVDQIMPQDLLYMSA